MSELLEGILIRERERETERERDKKERREIDVGSRILSAKSFTG
jgi:hypothetical protein